MTAAANRASTAGARPAQEPGTGLGTRREPVEMRVVETRFLSERVLQLGLTRADGGCFRFQPGQFCRVAVPGPDGELWRSYSIATPALPDTDTAICEIAVAPVAGGVATGFLFSRRVGDTVRVSGPFGRLVLPPPAAGHYVFIGTGTGMAPYRAMLPELEWRAQNHALEVTLVMGVRSREECLYADEFREFVRRAPETRRFLACYSRAGTEGLAPFESAGYVQQVVRDLALRPGRDRVFLCGNPDMIDECSGMLEADGFRKTELVREKYLPAPR